MSNTPMKSTESAKAVYDRLETDRKPYVTRAENCATYTIPALFPKDTDNGSTDYDTPYQSVGARGVNNLASKLGLALFPPNSPFFRLSVRDDVMQYLEATPDVKQQIEQKLVQQEQVIQKYIESNQIRVTLHEALKQLVVAGNCLIFLPPKEGGVKLYRLNDYVIQRDAMGNVIQMVTVDRLSVATIPQEVLNAAGLQDKEPDEEVSIYTHVFFSAIDQRYYSYQEVDEKQIPGYEGNFPVNACPWIPLRLVKMDGESYGRSYVEEYLGDLKTLEGLQKAIAEASAIAATVINLVNPNGITKVRNLVNAKNGGFVPGRPDDIAPLQLEKSQDLQIAKSTCDALEQRLSYAFMLNSAVQRQAERVTAEEIRYVAGELEDTLGGIYSILTQELQLPLVNRLIIQLQSIGMLSDMPENIVQPAVTTGVEALGRGHDYNKLTTFMSTISAVPEAAAVVNWGNFTRAVGSACNIDTTGIILTPEEIQQRQQQDLMSNMATAATPNLTKGMMDSMQPKQQ